jgi:hypothetical protein
LALIFFQSFRFWTFVLVSDFVLRISGLKIPAVRILEKILKRDKEPKIFSRGDKYGQGRPVGQAVADHPDRNFFRDPPLLQACP